MPEVVIGRGGYRARSKPFDNKDNEPFYERMRQNQREREAEARRESDARRRWESDRTRERERSYNPFDDFYEEVFRFFGGGRQNFRVPPPQQSSLLSDWQVLGFSGPVSKDQAKAAFRKLAMLHHPDHDKTPGASERFRKILDAYNRIMV